MYLFFAIKTFKLNCAISVLLRQYLVPELWHMGFNIAAELRYEVLPRKHRYIIIIITEMTDLASVK
jgi:hypothetical protein